MADTKISALTAASALGGTEEIPANQGGASRKVTATQLRTFIAPLFVRKTADETVTASTTLQDDNELFLPLLANTVYTLDGLIIYESPTTADLRAAFTVPADARILWGSPGPATTIASTTGIGDGDWKAVGSGAQLGRGGAGAGVKVNAFVKGTIVMGPTAGNVQFQFAQSTSDAGNTIVLIDSWISAQQR